MTKLVIMMLFGIASFVGVYVRRAQARRRLEELDSGRRCMACDSTNVETYRGNARCLRCGHVASLADLRSAQVSEQEIRELTKPDERQL